jgi:hypothetical protein
VRLLLLFARRHPDHRLNLPTGIEQIKPVDIIPDESRQEHYMSKAQDGSDAKA